VPSFAEVTERDPVVQQCDQDVAAVLGAFWVGKAEVQGRADVAVFETQSSEPGELISSCVLVVRPRRQADVPVAVAASGCLFVARGGESLQTVGADRSCHAVAHQTVVRLATQH